MSKIMEMKELSNKVHRNGFNPATRVCFTANVGEIIPARVVETLPGDVYNIDLFHFGRTSPCQTASYGRIREYYDVYFVPNRLLWRHFDNWVLQGENASFATSPVSKPSQPTYSPYFNSSSYLTYQGSVSDSQLNDGLMNRKAASKKLLSYLGYMYKTKSGEYDWRGLVALNPWRLLAYQKIYQDYFRFAQWEDVAPWTYNVDYMQYTDDMLIQLSGANYSNVTSMFDMRYCNYDKDYFFGIMPRPQFGDTSIAGPISGTLAGQLGQIASSNAVAGTDLDLYGDVSSNNNLSYVGSSTNNGNKTIRSNAFLQLQNSSDNNAGISVLALRQAEAYQKWKEITLSSSDRSVQSLISKHWNVNVSDVLSDKCIYLGGVAKTIDINEVVNTSFNTPEETAELRGKGISSNGGNIRFECKDYGTLMVVYHAKPLVEWKYSSIIERSLLKTKASDFAIPEFDSIGMQPVYKSEFIPIQNGNDLIQVVGYAPRYAEYKTNIDICLGEFEDTLESWVLPFEFPSNETVDYRAFKVSPHICDNMFAVNADVADQLRNFVNLDIKAVRNLDADGLPY